MSGGADPRIPETRRRRAETIAKSERVMTMSRSLTLTRSVLAEHIARATPAQLDFVESWFEAELASREQSKRARLLKAAGLPNAKTLDGYDWSNLRMPPDWGGPSSRPSSSSTDARTSCSTARSAPARAISPSPREGSHA